MKKLIGLAMLMALVGCSTNQTSAENAERVPASRVSYSGSGDSSVQITRDSGALGSGCYLGIFWDGQLAARIGSGETVRLSVPSGEHLVGMGDDPHGNGLCAIGGNAMREVPANLKPGQNRRYRVSGDMGGFQIAPSSF
ncbi:TPA: hypothetical protein ACRMKO_000285 [Pseudomonas aeruginosa]|uniref:hypothetical protein n=1 Tax=Pseudomonas aeruginosa TaxID=287 RepID=UPI0018C5A1AD|nr:hypothetical protein [Pseudomonas aeruginosa]MBG4422702.1 hypothetical protein [Pseudomonas aeruginosa]WMB67050.1 hypothetical protein RBH62_24830 [Pseudomonas aeruginosa]